VKARELADGVFWIGGCYRPNALVHSYQSVYAVAGEDRTLLVDQGHPKDWRLLERQLDALEAQGLPPVELLFATHVEPAHTGNLGRMARRYPAARIVGDLRDYHLVFPELADRLRPDGRAGDVLDLGGRTVELIDPLFHDGVTTLWAYDGLARTLFPSDGFSYLHYHGADECGKTAEELPGLPVEELTAFFADLAFWWTRFVDIEPIVAALERLFATRRVSVVAPAHGAPILDPAATVPKVLEGMRLGKQLDRAAVAARLEAAKPA
jgi:glyoxylase-like metal-dependent hydrolase (beta-lactamase superfamily II)